MHIATNPVTLQVAFGLGLSWLGLTRLAYWSLARKNRSAKVQ